MKYEKYLLSEKITLDEILFSREVRVDKENALIDKFKLPLVVLTMNIVGPYKVFNLVEKTFQRGCDLIKDCCLDKNLSIINIEIVEKNTGFEAYFIIDCSPLILKKYLVKIEDTHSIGRLLDIDVIDENMNKISRAQIGEYSRKCILCDIDVYECRRLRKHSVEELLEKEIEIMLHFFNEEYCTKLSQLSLKALLYEVNTTPKPGLVDLNNNGSHKDMDIYLFQDSAISLFPYFKKFVALGIKNKEKQPDLFFQELRELGKVAEIEMLKTTNNINTHKGTLFIFSIVLCSLGWLYANEKQYSRQLLINTIKELCIGLARDFEHIEKKSEYTNGEKIYLDNNLLGIRGEALMGFSSVLDFSIKKFIFYLDATKSFNESGVKTLLELIIKIKDTTLIHRSSYETLLRIQEDVKKLIKEDNNIIEATFQLDKKFIDLNLSVGGCADLLALTYFIYFFEESIDENFEIINS